MPPERPATARAGRRAYALELVPLLLVGFALLLKFVHLSLLVEADLGLERPGGGMGVLAATLSILAAMLGLTLLLPRRARYAVLFLLLFGGATLVLIDNLHIAYYNALPSLSQSVSLSQLYEFRASIVDLLRPDHYFYYLDSALMLLAAPVYWRATRETPGLPLLSRARLLLGAVALSLLAPLPAVADATLQRNRLDERTLRELAAANGVLSYHLADVYLHLAELRPPRRVAKARAFELVSRRQQRRQRPSPHFGAARGANLILISAESLMRFPLGASVNGQKLTPNLDAFAAESLNFVNFHDQTGVGKTSDAEFVALQSLHPLNLIPVAMRYADNSFMALPAILREAGYGTLSATAVAGFIWNMERVHARYGFEESRFADAFFASDRVQGWLSDEALFQQTATLLERRQQPFMAYLLTSSSHHPFEIPPTLKSLDLGRPGSGRVSDYLQSVHYLDRAFGNFMARLRQDGLLERSVVALYGDHHAYLGEGAAKELARLLGGSAERYEHELRLFRRLPFLVRLPHGLPRGRMQTVGGHLDIAPTLLGLLGLADPSGAMLGLDLLAEAPRLVVYRNGNFVTDEVYYTRRRGGPAQCFSVASGARADCAAAEAARAEADAQLEASDTIVKLDLIPEIAARFGLSRR